MTRTKKVHINMVFEDQDFIALEKIRHHLGILNYKDTVRTAIKKAAEAIK